MNDPRASHVVNPTPNHKGYNVHIPYRGYTISLSGDGSDTWVWEGDGNSELPMLFSYPDTSGETIRHMMDCVDLLIDGGV